MDLSVLILLGIVVIFVAGFTQGLTSFGFALIATPILGQILPLQQTVPIVVILSLCTNGVVLASCYKSADIRKIWLLILASLVAAPLGTYLLLFLSGDILKLATGTLIILVAALQLAGKTFPVKRDRLAYLPVGAASGLLNGSISMSGPPVALFLSNQGVGKETFRANISVYGIFLNIVTILTYLYGGLLTSETLHYTAWFVPSMLIGVFIGIRALKKLNEQRFKRIALWLIVLSGLWTIIGVVMG
ncbi:sulfite exporter TauE/SafE family protein [Paenibacillus rubinfantis]|uniref:sulfite exporter TauE/SafE family protein n=1 Tax=Paenibacillus rubinfantis TaxID=1720296 RepID=UPI00073F7F4C|nr:sulfite exporter TauE/SafE family protein [Paenibacillus rubinfantis]